MIQPFSTNQKGVGHVKKWRQEDLALRLKKGGIQGTLPNYQDDREKKAIG